LSRQRGLEQEFYKLSQECGGITVESESGKGTSFALYFPRVDAVVKPDSQAATKPESQSSADSRRQTRFLKLLGPTRFFKDIVIDRRLAY
jgi:hypothetical protein